MRTKSDYEKKRRKKGGGGASLEKREPRKTHTRALLSPSFDERYRAHEESSADETILYDGSRAAQQRVKRLRRFRGDGEKRCQS
tara:strand:+ start:472 stop:723 length:252 start_codon:yes stop_codon:yes gene_type:complete